MCVCVGGGEVWARACAFARVALSNMQRVCAILSSASLAPAYFSTFSYKWYGFRKEVAENKMCFGFLCSYNISHSKNNLARYRHKCDKIFM
jgi:hypothetical protein